MKVSDAMTRDVCVCAPRDTLRQCAAAMAKNDIGVLPVVDNNTLVGMVTDRDITVRGVAAGKGPDAAVAEVLSRELLYCFDDQDLEQVVRGMGTAKVRRVPVLRRDKHLTGLFSLGDAALRALAPATEAIAGVSQRGGPHSQSAETRRNI